MLESGESVDGNGSAALRLPSVKVQDPSKKLNGDEKSSHNVIFQSSNCYFGCPQIVTTLLSWIVRAPDVLTCERLGEIRDGFCFNEISMGGLRVQYRPCNSVKTSNGLQSYSAIEKELIRHYPEETEGIKKYLSECRSSVYPATLSLLLLKILSPPSTDKSSGIGCGSASGSSKGSGSSTDIIGVSGSGSSTGSDSVSGSSGSGSAGGYTSSYFSGSGSGNTSGDGSGSGSGSGNLDQTHIKSSPSLSVEVEHVHEHGSISSVLTQSCAPALGLGPGIQYENKQKYQYDLELYPGQSEIKSESQSGGRSGSESDSDDYSPQGETAWNQTGSGSGVRSRWPVWGAVTVSFSVCFSVCVRYWKMILEYVDGFFCKIYDEIYGGVKGIIFMISNFMSDVIFILRVKLYEALNSVAGETAETAVKRYVKVR